MTIFGASQSAIARARRRVALLVCAIGVNPAATLEAGFWFVRGKRVRAQNLVMGTAAQSADYYRYWTKFVEPTLLARAQSAECPLPHLVVWDLQSARVADTADTQLDAAARISGPVQFDRILATSLPAAANEVNTWVVPVPEGVRFAGAVRFYLTQCINENPGARLVYWDEDQVVQGHRRNPWLKTQWDELLYLAEGGLLGACAIRLDALIEAMVARTMGSAGNDDAHELMVAVGRTMDCRTAVHVPRILTHRGPFDEAAWRSAQLDAVKSVCGDFEVPDPDNERQQAFSLRPRLAQPVPSVSIIIPSRDRADLLETCLSGIARTQYPGSIETIVIDNGTVDPIALRLLETLPGRGIKVISHNGPFNFAELSNLGVEAADGEFVCLLNNDIEVIEPNWLTEMMRYATRPLTGAVGALLLYPDGTVQHAGVAVGVGGAAGHVYRNLPRGHIGHRRMHLISRRVTAVTGACLVVRRDHYRIVGGMDEVHFKVAFNDIDLCLKLAKAGLHNVFAAQAVLVHHESKSRGDDDAPWNRARFAQELAALRERWSTTDFVDPYHHPLFLRSSEQAVLGVGS